MSENVLKTIDEEQGVAYITLNRPEKHNAFDENVINTLNDTWNKLSQRPDIKAVILKARGKSFCAGADINWMAKAAKFGADENIDDARNLAQMLYNFYSLPQFTVSLVQGRALGGGLGLVACSDFVIAERHCVFSFPEVRLGLTPATIAPYIIKVIGPRHAKRYFQSAEQFTAQRALDIGLVHELGEDIEELEMMLEGLLETISQNDPQAIRHSKNLVTDLQDAEISEAICKETADRLAIIRGSDEAKRRLEAFLNKRKKE